MLRIRLRRVGKKGKPSYRIVVADATAPRDGAYLEWIGTYDPMVNPPAISLKQERAVMWLGQGAQPSDAVRRILAKNGILERVPEQRTKLRRGAASAVAEVATRVATVPVVAGDTPDEPPVDEAPADDTPDEPPVDEAPVDDTPDEAPVDDAPVDDAPADDTPDEAPVDEAAADATPDDAPVDDAPADDTPEEAPVDEAPADDTPDESPADDPSDETAS